MSAARLCLGLSTFRPYNASVAQQEILRRGVNCADHVAAIQALQQEDAQLRAQALGVLLNRPPPAVYQTNQVPLYQMPRSTNCTSQWIGNQVQTVCR